jgi:hypothetical protein
MTANTRKFLTLLAIGLVLFAILVTDTHRTAIASVWPYLEAFADYQAK